MQIKKRNSRIGGKKTTEWAGEIEIEKERCSDDLMLKWLAFNQRSDSFDNNGKSHRLLSHFSFILWSLWVIFMRIALFLPAIGRRFCVKGRTEMCSTKWCNQIRDVSNLMTFIKIKCKAKEHIIRTFAIGREFWTLLLLLLSLSLVPSKTHRKYSHEARPFEHALHGTQSINGRLHTVRM